MTDARAGWATSEEIAWAEAHGIDLREWVWIEHDAGVRAFAAMVQRTRQQRLRAIDRAIARRDDWLTELHRRGQSAAEKARREHRIEVARAVDKRQWQPICACGWAGRPVHTRKRAEQAARDELARIFTPLRAAVEHTETAPVAIKAAS